MDGLLENKVLDINANDAKDSKVEPRVRMLCGEIAVQQLINANPIVLVDGAGNPVIFHDIAFGWGTTSMITLSSAAQTGLSSWQRCLH